MSVTRRSDASAVVASPTPAWLDGVDPGAVASALDRLRAARIEDQVVVVAGHVGPDGDTLGAALALHLALVRGGVRSVPTVGEQPLKVPAPLASLPGVDALVGAAGLPAAAEVGLLVTVDAAGPERLGTVARYLDAGVPTLVIDHHAEGQSFGDVRLIAPRAAATVQVIAHLLAELGVALDRELATCLYVGLVTDTGRFGHASTDADAHRLAAQLLEAGVDHADLTRRLYDTRSLAELRLLGAALGRLSFVPDVSLVHTHVTHEEMARAGGGLEATEALIDLVRSADVADTAMVCKPDPDGRWRVSMRSKGAVDVAAVAARFGGGGHTAAAGFTAAGTPEQLAADVAALLREG